MHIKVSEITLVYDYNFYKMHMKAYSYAWNLFENFTIWNTFIDLAFTSYITTIFYKIYFIIKQLKYT